MTKSVFKLAFTVLYNADSPPRCRSRLERSPRMPKVGCSNPIRDRLKSLKSSDSSTAKRSALDMSVTGLRRLLL